MRIEEDAVADRQQALCQLVAAGKAVRFCPGVLQLAARVLAAGIPVGGRPHQDALEAIHIRSPQPDAHLYGIGIYEIGEVRVLGEGAQVVPGFLLRPLLILLDYVVVFETLPADAADVGVAADVHGVVATLAPCDQLCHKGVDAGGVLLYHAVGVLEQGICRRHGLVTPVHQRLVQHPGLFQAVMHLGQAFSHNLFVFRHPLFEAGNLARPGILEVDAADAGDTYGEIAHLFDIAILCCRFVEFGEIDLHLDLVHINLKVALREDVLAGGGVHHLQVVEPGRGGLAAGGQVAGGKKAHLDVCGAGVKTVYVKRISLPLAVHAQMFEPSAEGQQVFVSIVAVYNQLCGGLFARFEAYADAVGGVALDRD